MLKISANSDNKQKSFFAKKNIRHVKAELLQVDIFFSLNFLPLEFLFIEKSEIEKTKTTQYTTFKTDMIKVVSVFSISNLFTNKNSQGRKLRAV